MASINDVFELTKYKANKSGYLGYISPNDFNRLFPRAEIRYFNKEYTMYAATQRISDTLSKFKSDPTPITISGSGSYSFPNDMLHVDAITHTYNGAQVEVTRVESDRVANNLSSAYDAPNEEFPIYTQYKTTLQFYPITLGNAILIYLKKPTTSFWAYTLNGILTTNTLVGGSGYTIGIYTNVPIVGGTGTGGRASVSVVGGVVTNVSIDVPGSNYTVGDTLTVTTANLGGTGSGFSFKVASLTGNRPVYDPVNSIDPQWSDTDIDNIIYLLLQDIGVNMRDAELENFAMTEAKTQT